MKFGYPEQPCCPGFSFPRHFQNLFTHITSVVVDLYCMTNSLKNLRTSWGQQVDYVWANLIWARLGKWLWFGVLICWFGFRLWVGCRSVSHVLFHTEASSYLGTVLTANGRSTHFDLLFTSLHFTFRRRRQVIWPNPKSMNREIYSFFRGEKGKSHGKKHECVILT